MSSISINLDPVALREATSQAIMGILTPEVKAKIIEEAIRAVLAPSTNSWERGKSPLQTAFESAIVRIANDYAVELIKSDEALRERIKTLTRLAGDKLMAIDEQKLADGMVTALTSSLRGSS